jgi:hypothetical protein
MKSKGCGPPGQKGLKTAINQLMKGRGACAIRTGFSAGEDIDNDRRNIDCRLCMAINKKKKHFCYMMINDVYNQLPFTVYNQLTNFN